MWKYKVIYVSPEVPVKDHGGVLNEQGNMGWELVNTIFTPVLFVFYFKQPKEEA